MNVYGTLYLEHFQGSKAFVGLAGFGDLSDSRTLLDFLVLPEAGKKFIHMSVCHQGLLVVEGEHAKGVEHPDERSIGKKSFFFLPLSTKAFNVPQELPG